VAQFIISIRIDCIRELKKGAPKVRKVLTWLALFNLKKGSHRQIIALNMAPLQWV